MSLHFSVPMKYVHFDRPGSAEVLYWVEGQPPLPKKGEVLIQIHAAGVNRPDIYQRKGHYPPPPGDSEILGLEVAGTVIQCGEATTRWKVGDPVCALVNGGGYSNYCCVPATQCLPVPEGMSFEEAAGLPETYFTVWYNVFMKAHLRAGEKILIHGGSSGIGTTAIQLSQAFGAMPSVTAGSDDKCQACLQLGAHHAVNYRQKDFETEFRDHLNVQFDVILDMVGGDYLKKNVRLLNQNGRIVQIAFQKGSEACFSMQDLMSKEGILTGSYLRRKTPEKKAEIAASLEKSVWPLLKNKTVRPIIDHIFPFEKVVQAHQHLEEGAHTGKIILSWRN